MTEEWVSFWYQALSENADYNGYCSVVDSGDHVKQKAYEARFERVADIYKDFGPLDGWRDDMLNSSYWKSWYQTRKPLFVVEPFEVPKPASYIQNPASLLVSVPLAADAQTTAKSVAEFLADYYSSHQVRPHPAPKYQLHSLNGRVAHGKQKVRIACLTSYRSYAIDDDGQYRSIRETILKFLQSEIDNLGWTMKPKVRELLMEKGAISEDDYESYRVMLDKARRDFKAFSKNAIRGRFPDDTAFDSEVMDQFWGE